MTSKSSPTSKSGPLSMSSKGSRRVSVGNVSALAEDNKAKTIAHNEEFVLPADNDSIRFFVDYEYRVMPGTVPRLRLSLYCYDDRGHYADRITEDSPRSKDDSAVLTGEIESIREQHVTATVKSIHCARLNMTKVNPGITSILLCLSGEPRSFNNVTGATLRCCQAPGDRGEGTFMAGASNTGTIPLFKSSSRTRKDCLDIAVCVIYKDGWDDGGMPRWAAMPLFEPIFQTLPAAKEAFCSQLVIGVVPCLEMCRPRLFPTVRGLCSALSSEALPKLKKKFSVDLNMEEFTEVLFTTLFETNSKIIDPVEAPFAVAMIQEMFLQIDYNGDGSSSWHEFTTFLSTTGLTASQNRSKDVSVNDHISEDMDSLANGGLELDVYHIEYIEERQRRDRVLSSQQVLWAMRYFPGSKRIAIIPTDSDRIMMMDENFTLLTTIEGARLSSAAVGTKLQMAALSGLASQLIPLSGSKADDLNTVVYDVCHLAGRDLYAYSASDHSITIVKEQQGYGGFYFYLIHNRFLSPTIHSKLCWSESEQVLCSVTPDGVIFGWDVDGSQPTFQVSRHSDLITDFIAVNHMNMFITCSMDRRIVMWSAHNRRVRAVWTVHSRGVRCLSVSESCSTLLSGSFDCDARTFDLNSKENIALLRGHQHPITAVQLMCERSATEREHRALTVDESGQFRLWSIYVRERASEAQPVPTMQVFYMQTPEWPIDQFRWLAIPDSSMRCMSEFSDFFACSTKLVHFIPNKQPKAFSPPTAVLFHESQCFVVTAIGRTIIKYDIATGNFLGYFSDISNSDITAMCEDGNRGRRLLIGNDQGRYYLINFTDGNVIDELKVHTKGIVNEMKIHTMEVTSLLCRRMGDRTLIYSSSVDGSIALCEEASGRLSVRYLLDFAFAQKIGISYLEHAPSLGVLVACSTSSFWGVWDDASLRRIVCIREKSHVNALRIIGASRDEEDLAFLREELPKMSKVQQEQRKKECLLTVAVASIGVINVYTIDTFEVKGVRTSQMVFHKDLYITDIIICRLPTDRGANFSLFKPVAAKMVGVQVFACTDDGTILSWDGNELRDKGEKGYRLTHTSVLARREPEEESTSGVPLLPPHRRDKDSQRASLSEEITRRQSLGLTPDELAELMLVNARFTDTFFKVALSVPMEKSSSEKGEGEGRSGTPGGRRRRKGFVDSLADGVVENIEPNRQWKGHSDSVMKVVSLAEHGCVMSLSADGYHRIWNIETECLGEMPLPNLLDGMKMEAANLDKRPAEGWKFVVQRLPVTEEHKDIAKRLTKMILQRAGGGTASNNGDANNGESSKSLNSSILSISTRYPLRMPITSSALASSKEVMSLPTLSSTRSLPSLSSELDDDDLSSYDNDYLIDARHALEQPSRGNSTHDFLSRKEGLLSTPLTSSSSRLRQGAEDMDFHLQEDKDIFRSSLLRSLATDPPATIIDNTPIKLLTKREMDTLRAQCAEHHALEQSLHVSMSANNLENSPTSNVSLASSALGSARDRVGRIKLQSPPVNLSEGGELARYLLDEQAKIKPTDERRTPVLRSSMRLSISSSLTAGTKYNPKITSWQSSQKTPKTQKFQRSVKSTQWQRSQKSVGTLASQDEWDGDDESISTLGTGGVSSFPMQPIKMRRRGVDPVLPNHMVDKFASQVISRQKALLNEDEYTISCTTGDPISKSKWLAPSELGHATNISSFKLSEPFSEQSMMKSEYEPRIGAEALRTLRGMVERDPDRIAKFSDSPQQLILRSPSQSTSIKVPPLVDVRVTDAVFGQQSDLYKNATKHLKAENRLSTALVRHSVVLGRIQDNVRRVQTMMQVVGKEKTDSAYDKYVDIKDEEEEAAKWQAASQEDVLSVTSHAGYEPNMFSTSSRSMFTTNSAVSNLSTTTTFVGSVAEGWDVESEYKSRMRLQKSAALISPEAAMRARALDKEGIEQRVNKALDEVAEEEQSVHDKEQQFVRGGTLKSHQKAQAIAALKAKNKIVHSIDIRALEALEDKLIVRVKFVLASFMSRRQTIAPPTMERRLSVSPALIEEHRLSLSVPFIDYSGSPTSPSSSLPSPTQEGSMTMSSSFLFASPFQDNNNNNNKNNPEYNGQGTTSTKNMKKQISFQGDEIIKTAAAAAAAAVAGRSSSPQSLGDSLPSIRPFGGPNGGGGSTLDNGHRSPSLLALSSKPLSPLQLLQQQNASQPPSGSTSSRSAISTARRSSSASSVNSVASRSSVNHAAPSKANVQGKRNVTKLLSSAKSRSIRGNQLTDDGSKNRASLANIQEGADSDDEDASEGGGDTLLKTAGDQHTTKEASHPHRRSTPTTLRITGSDGNELTITNRMLAPNYIVDDISRFCEIFAYADQEQKGKLNIDQWTELFQKIDAEISEQQARLIFMRLDADQSGALSLGELIPVVFCTANKMQLKLIEQYAGMQCVFGLANIEVPEFRMIEAEQLFDAYDPNSINFVSIELIKDRVRNNYNLPETIQYQFLSPLEEIEDSDMFSRLEFYRFLRPYLHSEKK